MSIALTPAGGSSGPGSGLNSGAGSAASVHVSVVVSRLRLAWQRREADSARRIAAELRDYCEQDPTAVGHLTSEIIGLSTSRDRQDSDLLFVVMGGVRSPLVSSEILRVLDALRGMPTLSVVAAIACAQDRAHGGPRATMVYSRDHGVDYFPGPICERPLRDYLGSILREPGPFEWRLTAALALESSSVCEDIVDAAICTIGSAPTHENDERIQAVALGMLQTALERKCLEEHLERRAAMAIGSLVSRKSWQCAEGTRVLSCARPSLRFEVFMRLVKESNDPSVQLCAFRALATDWQHPETGAAVRAGLRECARTIPSLQADIDQLESILRESRDK